LNLIGIEHLASTVSAPRRWEVPSTDSGSSSIPRLDRNDWADLETILSVERLAEAFPRFPLFRNRKAPKLRWFSWAGLDFRVNRNRATIAALWGKAMRKTNVDGLRTLSAGGQP